MKIILLFLIVLCFGLIGYFYKQKLKDEKEAYLILKSYVEFLSANITLFKTNLAEINNNYIIMQKNKNAKSYKLIYKNTNNHVINPVIFEKLIQNKNDYFVIKSFFENLGKNEYEFEKESIKEFEKFVDLRLKNQEFLIKNKGDLTFKIMLAIGAIVAILLWWKWWKFLFCLE